MTFPATMSYDEYPSMDFESSQHDNQQEETEWNSLEKFLEWQQDQPEFSSPESLLSDVDPTSNFDHQPFQADNRFSQAEDIPVTMSPKSRLQTPQNIAPPMHEDSTLYPPPGPQLPKIGRPRSTPNTLSTPDLEAGKAPSQARRRSQNREAQRAFRLRQRQHIDQIAVENRELIAKNEELEARCEMLAKAYHRVLAANTRMGGVGGEQQQVKNGGEFGMPWMQNGLVSRNWQ